MTEQETRKYLNKLKFMTKINGYEEGWIHSTLVCEYCAGVRHKSICRKPRKLRIKNGILLDIGFHKKPALDPGSCVEFLRSPKKA